MCVVVFVLILDTSKCDRSRSLHGTKVWAGDLSTFFYVKIHHNEILSRKCPRQRQKDDHVIFVVVVIFFIFFLRNAPNRNQIENDTSLLCILVLPLEPSPIWIPLSASWNWLKVSPVWHQCLGTELMNGQHDISIYCSGCFLVCYTYSWPKFKTMGQTVIRTSVFNKRHAINAFDTSNTGGLNII